MSTSVKGFKGYNDYKDYNDYKEFKQAPRARIAIVEESDKVIPFTNTSRAGSWWLRTAVPSPS
jgi:hypothetical protein